ncbi:MAG: serine hydrolase [Clostridia bacterium]|nr:serine hydrolase [Clostridia bacterium]
MKHINKNRLNKLKNAKKRKRKLRNIISLIVASIIIINISFIRFSEKKVKANNIPEEIKETVSSTEENTLQNTTVENIVEENKNEIATNTATQENIIEEKKEIESAKIKEVIENYINNEGLNSTNFAFFYYNVEKNEYYFYNEYTYFTAASTIKVPLAMVYYDKINNKDLTLESTLQYKSENYEAGAGNTSSTYKAGDYIPLSFLLKEMIVNSDNTATNILKTGLGGETAYRILIKQYTKENLIEQFNTDNVTTAKYSYDVLKRLYENQDKYQELISLMKKSSGGGYLKKKVTNYEIAHKYGSFEGNVHDFGIVYADTTYLIGVFTKDINNAENLIADINKSVLENN